MCEMQQNQKPRLKPYVKGNAYLIVKCNGKDFAAQAPRTTLTESFYTNMLFQLLSLPCDGGNSWKWLYPIKDCSLGPSQSVCCRAVRPCDVVTQVYPVSVQNSIYTFDSMNDRFGFAVVT